MPVVELKDQVRELKQKLSASENAYAHLSKDYAASLKQAAKASALEATVIALEQTVNDRNSQIDRLRADVAFAQAKAAQADVILEAARGLKRLIGSV